MLWLLPILRSVGPHLKQNCMKKAWSLASNSCKAQAANPLPQEVAPHAIMKDSDVIQCPLFGSLLCPWNGCVDSQSHNTSKLDSSWGYTSRCFHMPCTVTFHPTSYCLSLTWSSPTSHRCFISACHIDTTVCHFKDTAKYLSRSTCSDNGSHITTMVGSHVGYRSWCFHISQAVNLPSRLILS